MKKILLSVATLAFVGVVVAGATGAFFSDTETSTGNTFTAGAIDLKVDSTSHYNNMVCTIGTNGVSTWQPEAGAFPSGVPVDHYPQPNTSCGGTWTQKDLGAGTDKFFNLTDVKPGDNGENTISLHVYSNDSWGRFVISNVQDLDNSCTEPESEVGGLEPECLTPSTTSTTQGELAESISFYAWLDQGATPGFQNIGANGVQIDGNGTGDGSPLVDPTEGDNIQNSNEPTVITPGDVDENGEIHNIWPALAAVYAAYCPNSNEQGATGYTACQGIAKDGRLVGSTTYYFGLAWNIPTTVGNEAQTDSLNADLSFEAVQQRNNPTQTF